MSAEAASTTSVPQILPAKEADELPPFKIRGQATLVVLALAGLADWLFYGHSIGISLVLFLVALAAGSAIVNSVASGARAAALAFFVLLAGLLPFAVTASPLAFLFSAGATAYFVAVLASKPTSSFADQVAAARGLLLDCGWRAGVDILKSPFGRPQSEPLTHANTLIVWIVPLGLGSVFLWLFADANPLIKQWISAIDPSVLAARLDNARVAFWLLMASLVWPFIVLRIRRRRAAKAQKAAASGKADLPKPISEVLGRAAILRSLIVFNGLFAVQTVLDGLYLWGGVALPEGMTYAQYAHHGAYSLIATALLAAAFVIVALKPGSDMEREPLIRTLVCLWIAQNVWLVISSILRLELYVAAYSLTYWRVAAFIWMLLVAMGLALILARIALGRSNRWLIGANLVSLTLTLYVCAFVNFAGIIAHYNVMHSAEMGGGGPTLDRNYLRSLGRHAVPAADDFVARNPDNSPNQFSYQFPSWREDMAAALRTDMQDWRTWNYWDWDLMRHLDEAASQPSVGP